MLSYDKLSFNHQILLDLPFREGVGAITRDVAKPHHQDIDLINTPTWENLASGLGVIAFNGLSEYLELAFADCADLDFTTGDYSYGVWVNREAGVPSQIIIGRYVLSNNGWEIYFFDPAETLSLRQHHAAGASVRTSCWSAGWTLNTWHFLGISRTGGGNAIHYRNGVALTTIGDLLDPEACNQDLVMGARYTKNANYFKGKMWRPRVWDRTLSAKEWARLFSIERHWFGV